MVGGGWEGGEDGCMEGEERRGEERGEVRGQMGEKLFVGAVYVRIWTYICQCA